MRRALRFFAVPAALGALAAAALHRALEGEQLTVATVLGVLAGTAAGALLGSRVPLFASGPAAIAVGYVTAALLGGDWSPTAVPDAAYLFLTIGLPADGLASPALVGFAAAWLAATSATALAMRGHTLASVVAPGGVLVAVALAVVPVGMSWVVPALFVAGAAIAFLLDARLDLSHLPPLTGSNTESRRQLVWWRPLVQLAPAVAAVALAVALRPVERAVDIRDVVDPAGVQLDGVNPLAIAGRASQIPAEEAAPFATVEVSAGGVGRMRSAVLDRYEATGWRQSAEFTETGRQLAPDPMFDQELRQPSDREITVRVQPERGAPLESLPTAAEPVRVASPGDVRYAPVAEALIPIGQPASVTYDVRAVQPLEAVDATVGRFPDELVACPQSEPIRTVANQLATGATSALERLARIESFLKVRRVFDPAAPGGQTLRSVERFVEQDFARGNLEVFVSAHALLARCAGVPVRVVVGLPAPEPGTNLFTDRDITAWVETPLAQSGWVAVDPLPTPEEQLQQAQLARRPDPTTSTTLRPDPATAPAEVPPLEIDDPAESSALVVSVALSVAALLLVGLWTWWAPRAIRSRRRRAADPTVAVLASWHAVADALADRGLPIEEHQTPSEVARLVSGRVPLVVPRLVEGLAPLLDTAQYSGVPASGEEAGRAWAFADAIVQRLPSTRRASFVAVLRPRQTLERLIASRRIRRRRRPWRGVLPEAFLVADTEAPQDVPGVALAARIGEGATGTVYRGALATTGEAVAVKVFRYGPGDTGFDAQRFEWEVRVAQEVSGHPHVPVVHDAGITPMTGRPYIVTTHYAGGTLLERIGRGGPMTETEVVAMGADLAVALMTMHQLGVVHADVKPENVFFGGDGWVLGDLGSAWLRASRGPAASLTPPYAAPEVWRGGAPTPLADLYSLGLTMLFAAAGRVPIAGVPPAREEVVELFPNHPVMLRALEPDARRRPRTVADFLRQLRPELAAAGTGTFLATLSLPTPTVTHARPTKKGSQA